MPVNIGVNIQRSPNRINQQLREAGVEGKFPKLLLDFKDQYYLASGGSKTLANAVTHARSGNATMTDGYGPELVTNGGFTSDSDWTKGTGWSIRNGLAYCDGSQTGSSLLEQSWDAEIGDVYVFSFRVVSRDAGGVSAAVQGATPEAPYVTATGYYEQVVRITDSTTAFSIRASSSFIGSIDNVSVREMPVLKWAPHNLFTYSEEFDNAAWLKRGTATVTPNDTTAPDGTLTADLLSGIGAGANDIYQVVTIPAGIPCGVGLFIKRVSTSGSIFIQSPQSQINGRWTVDLSSLSDDWELINEDNPAVTVDYAFSGFPNSGFLIRSTTATELSFHAWGAHFYRSDLGGMVDNPDQPASRASYVPTTSSAAYLPRIGHHVYNGNSWVNEGLLAESEARTNLFHYSHDFSDSYWGKAHLTVTADQGIAPDGTNTAFKLIESSTSNIARHVTRGGGTLANSTQYTAAVYLKKGTRTKAKINVFTGAASHTGKYDIENGTVYSSAGADAATIEDVGNGWFRCSITTTTSASGTANVAFGMLPDSYDVVYDGDGSSYIYAWGATLEASPTRSSYIPTTGAATVTRAAETFTIPSANLPWPTPQYIGDNIVTNGTFDTDSDWTKGTGWSISGGQATHVAGTGSNLQQSVAYGSSGTIYALSVDVVSISGGSGSIQARSGGATTAKTIDGNTSGTTVTLIYVHDGLNTDVAIYAGSGTSLTVDNISVREINPLSVSIAMDGRITYADTNSGEEVVFVNWFADTNNKILERVRTNVGTGDFTTQQSASGTADTVSSGGSIYTPNVLVPFNIAARHGSTFINGATDGVAFTANTTPTALPDLSATNLSLANDYMGTVGTFRVWDRDITDAGLVEATNPSLEPSLSLTFEGTGTNSFIVNDWSE
jgi:hypothetical protein